MMVKNTLFCGSRLNITTAILFFCLLSFSMGQSFVISKKTQKQMDELFSHLEDWPLPKAKQAANLLMKRPLLTVPVFLRKLDSKESSRMRQASVYCLGKLKAKEGFSEILKIISDPAMENQLSTIFAALAEIDENKAYSLLLKHMQSSRIVYRNPAFENLLLITKEKHLPLLKKALKSKYSASREYAIELIFRLQTKESISVLFSQLGDNSAQVNSKIVEKLGTLDSDLVRQQLLAFSKNTDKEMQSYALLALVQQEDYFHLSLFNEEWISSILLSLRHNDYFIRGSAATALVNIGFSNDSPEIIEIMNTHLVPILLHTVMGGVYYKQYLVLREFAYKKLTQLTGKDYGYSQKNWWQWWEKNKKSFHAVRLLRGVSPEQVAQSKITYIYEQGKEKKQITFLATPKKTNGSGQIFFLSQGKMIEVLNLLPQISFFELEKVYGLEEKGLPRFTIEVKIKSEEKTVVVYGREGGLLRQVIDKIEATTEENVWQLYWDSYYFPDWDDWYAQNRAWFDKNKDPEKRDQRLKKMLVSSYSWLKPEKRKDVARQFFLLMQKNDFLSDGSVQLAILHIKTELDINEITEYWVRGIAYSKKEYALTSLLDFLGQKYTLRARELIGFLLRQVPQETLIKYLRHTNLHLRSIAIEVLSEYSPTSSSNLYIQSVLEDSSDEVKESAIKACGKLRIKATVDSLRTLLVQNHQNAKMITLLLSSLIQIEGVEAFSTIQQYLAEPKSEIRQSACVALGVSSDKIFSDALLQVLLNDTSKEVRKAAARSLAKQNTPEVQAALWNIFYQEKLSSPLRCLALEALSEGNTKKPSKKLKLLLQSEDKLIRTMVAIHLAPFWEKEAVPNLIEGLLPQKQEYPNLRLLSQQALERITFTRFQENNSTQLHKTYLQWWKKHQELSVLEWFFHSVRKKGYDVAPLLDVLLETEEQNQAIPLLIRVLKKEDWYLKDGSLWLLEKLSGEHFGRITPQTPLEVREGIIAKWTTDSR